MRIVEHVRLSPREFERTVVTIGNFDGVHLGHQHVLGQVVKRAQVLGAAAVVYTFHPHPLKVLNPPFCPPLLTSFEDRIRLIAATGVDGLVWVNFTREYAAQEPDQFARQTLRQQLGALEIWVGADFVFGRGRKGSIDLLRRVGAETGFQLHVVEPFQLDGEPVSSTRVRQAVAEADFSLARRLLGRPFSVRGPVVHGKARGRTLGFPTANVVPQQECLPPAGVYAAWASVEGKAHRAAVNVGRNPTFGPAELTVEAFLLDFAGDLYGKELELAFDAAVRGEITFRQPEDLVRQIQRDVDAVRSILSQTDQTTPVSA